MKRREEKRREKIDEKRRGKQRTQEKDDRPTKIVVNKYPNTRIFWSAVFNENTFCAHVKYVTCACVLVVY